MAAVLNVLSLSVRISEDDPVAGWPQLILSVDGEELFSPDDEGIGVDPSELTGDDGALLTDSERIVILRLCECGESGCGFIEVRIRRDGNHYVWDRWAGPIQTTRPLPTLTFDARQYESVARQSLRPSWPSSNS
jgi:hypothetical protein